jgi:hypothetical protein
MVSTYPPRTEKNGARHARLNGGLHESLHLTDESSPPTEIGDTSPWWLRRVQQDAELLESLLVDLAKANRGPLALGGISREYRRFADRHPGTERMSRDRIYGALVLLALRSRVHIYGDGSDSSTAPTFVALNGIIAAH